MLDEINNRPDLSDVTLKDILDTCDLTEEKYENALETLNSKVSIIYKRKPLEKDISPYNPVILNLMKSNMNLQFVTGVYGLLAYLTSYLCKPEHGMSELMKKASKEASGEDMRGKLRKIGNVFLTKREVSTHEAIKRVLSLPMRSSNVKTIYIPTGLKKDRTRMLKPQHLLNIMDPEDTNVYATNIIERYANRPDDLESLCYADFATNYINIKVDENLESDDIENYTTPVSSIDDVEPSSNIIVLKNKLGKMRKRTYPSVMCYHKVSKLKDSEHYHMTLLQLYMPWRDEDHIKEGCSSYKEKFDEVESDILPNIQRHDAFYGKFDLDDEDLLNNCYDSSDDDDDDDDNDNEFGMLHPDLLDLDMEADSGTNNGPVASSFVQNSSLPCGVFHDMCSKLNEGQQKLFNFIMKYAQELMLNKRNDLPDPDPFHIFLSGGAGVGKSYLVTLITEYLKKTLKYPTQNFDDQPSVVVTASTGKAATNVNGTTLHSAFTLPIREAGFKVGKPTQKKLDKMKPQYQYLKALLIDEISMTGKETFDDLNKYMRHILDEKLDFGGVSILSIGDFFQLPPVKQKFIFMILTLTDAWNLFSLHELHEIVRQNSDPHFAQLLNRLREGNHTDADIEDIKALADTDISDMPDDHVKCYVTNNLVNKENDKAMNRFIEEGGIMYVFHAKDSKADSRTGAFEVITLDDDCISNTGNLPKQLKICVGTRVMLTDNMDIGDRLINGSIGTVIHIQSRRLNGTASGTIYVKFDDEKAGNKLKDNRLRGELKHCVPVSVIHKEFQYKNKKGTKIRAERKQFPLVLAHAITIHKSQGSTLEYMTGDMDQTTGKGNRKAPVSAGMFYTLLSRARSRDKLKILNFKESHIKVSQAVVQEMERMRRDCLFSWNHPLIEMKGTKICLFNIVSWNLHIPHFLSDKYFVNYSSVFCFTETHTNNKDFKKFEEYHPGWKSIHHPTAEHGLAICYDTETVVIEKEFSTSGLLQVLPVAMKIEDELVLLVLVYRPPGARGTFVYELTQLLTMLDIHRYRTIVLGDFNLDQMLPENIEAFGGFCTQFNFNQRSTYSTHIRGGILDLVFDDKKSESVQWMPSPYSDHFVILIDI